MFYGNVFAGLKNVGLGWNICNHWDVTETNWKKHLSDQSETLHGYWKDKSSGHTWYLTMLYVTVCFNGCACWKSAQLFPFCRSNESHADATGPQSQWLPHEECSLFTNLGLQTGATPRQVCGDRCCKTSETLHIQYSRLVLPRIN